MRSVIMCIICLVFVQTTVGQQDLNRARSDRSLILRHRQAGPDPRNGQWTLNKIEIGKVGTLPFATEVLQVIDSKNAIVVIKTQNENDTVWVIFPTKGVVNDRCYVFTKTGPEMVDNEKSYGPLQFFKVTGTKTYNTGVGTNTCFVIEACDDPSPEPNPEPKSKPKLKPKTQIVRKWTSADGKFSVEAKFMQVIAEVVYLSRKDGTIIQVSRDKLSQSDLEWIKEQAR